MTRRFKDLKRVIRTSIVTNDCFGLKAPSPLSLVALAELTPIRPGQFAYLRDADKVDEFMQWLLEQEQKGILELVQGVDPLGVRGSFPWTNLYVRRAYEHGIKMGRLDLKRQGIEIAEFANVSQFALSSALQSPFHLDRVGLAFTRVFNELKGVTATMDGQISRVLANGLARGESPYKIARDINDRVDKIGITRARLIARTETTFVHNSAGLNEFERAEAVLGEEVFVQWWSALDVRVRPSHDKGHGGRHGRIYTRAEGMTLIGDPNCRCALLPWVPDFAEEGDQTNFSEAVREALRQAA